MLLVDTWASIINLRNCVASIATSTLSVALFKLNVEEERDIGVWTNTGSGVRGGMRILEVKIWTGADAVEITLYESFNENPSDNIVEGKHWPITFAMIVERNEKKIMSAARILKVRDPSYSPWGIDASDTLKVIDVKEIVTNWIHDTLASRSIEPLGIAKYATTVTVKCLIEMEREEEREWIRRKKEWQSLFYGMTLRWCSAERFCESSVRYYQPRCADMPAKTILSWQR